MRKTKTIYWLSFGRVLLTVYSEYGNAVIRRKKCICMVHLKKLNTKMISLTKIRFRFDATVKLAFSYEDIEIPGPVIRVYQPIHWFLKICSTKIWENSCDGTKFVFIARGLSEYDSDIPQDNIYYLCNETIEND